ncbi:MAG: hypothetical protein K8J09_04945, partial [Planctomycetes bacterium]|nr:hypothetical protein [Planctomycetota bacterium]
SSLAPALAPDCSRFGGWRCGPGKPGGPQLAADSRGVERRLERVALGVVDPAHPCFVFDNRYITVVRGSQLAGFEVTPTGRF